MFCENIEFVLWVCEIKNFVVIVMDVFKEVGVVELVD